MTTCVASIQSFVLLQRSWEEVFGDGEVLNFKITFFFHSVLFLQLRREATSMRTLRVDRNNCLPPVYICGRTERAIITPDLSPPNILQYFLCHCNFLCLFCYHCLCFCRVCCTWYHWRTALTAAWPLVIVRAAELSSITTGTTIITSVVVIVVVPFGQK